MGFHWYELLPILLLAVLFLGPNRLPSAGKSLGQAIRGFKEETKGLREELAPIHENVASLKNEVTEARKAVTSTVSETLTGNSSAT